MYELWKIWTLQGRLSGYVRGKKVVNEIGNTFDVGEGTSSIKHNNDNEEKGDGFWRVVQKQQR